MFIKNYEIMKKCNVRSKGKNRLKKSIDKTLEIHKKCIKYLSKGVLKVYNNLTLHLYE